MSILSISLPFLKENDMFVKHNRQGILWISIGGISLQWWGRRRNPKKKMIWFPGERFVNDFKRPVSPRNYKKAYWREYRLTKINLKNKR